MNEITQAPEELVDALSGEILGPPTVDNLIDLWERYAAAEAAARNAKLHIASALAAKVPPQQDGCRTMRVRGDKRRVKVEFPDDAWDQSKLKEAWHAFPTYRDEFLSISALRVQLTEYKKALHEAGPEPFELFKSILQDANRGPQGAVRIVIEE